MDRLLAGPLTEALARSLGEHRVVERLAGELVRSGAIEEALTAALEHEDAQRLIESALALGLERLLVAVLESRLVPEITERLLHSAEMHAVLEYVVTSPEVRRVLTEQSSGLADEMVDGLRTRTESLDESAERRVRGWLRRPRGAAGADEPARPGPVRGDRDTGDRAGDRCRPRGAHLRDGAALSDLLALSSGTSGRPGWPECSWRPRGC